MGGRALKVAITERKSTIDYNRISLEITNVLFKLGIDTKCVQSYYNKKDHGDLDVLIRKNERLNNINLVDFIKEHFNPTEIYNNGGVISFDYDSFQIDFISIQEEDWNFAIKWFDFDPFSNIAGKIAHKLGLKFGWSGLIFPVRSFSGRQTKDIVVTKNHQKVVEFLGFNYNKYLKGFDEMEKIFDFIIGSKYFDHNIFQWDNMNSIDRKRNRKRSSYQKFLEYLIENNITKTYEFKEKVDYIDEIDKYFPEARLKEQIQELQKIDDENESIYNKFNGKLIMELYPELKDKELGDMMNKFRDSFDDFRIYALEHSSDEILNDFKTFKNK
jgi:hypothetical protein